MTDPNQTPQDKPEMPTFSTPGPSLGQRASMRLAGAALGLGFNANPSSTLTTLVTQVGGYTPSDFGGQQTTTFVKKPERALYRPAKRDETVKGHSSQRHYRSAADFQQETSGLFLEDAAARVSSGQEARTGHLRLRERAARSLVRRSMRGGRYYNTRPN